MSTIYQLRSELANIETHQELADIMKVDASRKFPTARKSWDVWRGYERELEGMLDVMMECAVHEKDQPVPVLDESLRGIQTDEGRSSFLGAAVLERFPSLRERLRALETSGTDWLFSDDAAHGYEMCIVVVIGSNKGYCGGFNRNVRQEFDSVIRDIPKNTVKLICIGRKCRAYFRKDEGLFKKLIPKDFPEESRTEKTHWTEKSSLASWILNDSMPSVVGSGGHFYPLTVVYNRLSETQDRQFKVGPVSEQILPLVAKALENRAQNSSYRTIQNPRYLFEPEIPYLRALLSADLLYGRMMRILCESEASEQYSRMKAMSEASENIGNEIELLKRTINKTRQASITRELIEIISGAEAFKKAAEA